MAMKMTTAKKDLVISTGLGVFCQGSNPSFCANDKAVIQQ
jgi:hypothetical protein